MIESIKFDALNCTKDSSKKYYVKYANDQLIPCIRIFIANNLQISKRCKEDDEDLTFPEQEYRALRHAIRHFEDNWDVLEMESPREQVQ